jgi:hypothetical protein
MSGSRAKRDPGGRVGLERTGRQRGSSAEAGGLLASRDGREERSSRLGRSISLYASEGEQLR